MAANRHQSTAAFKAKVVLQVLSGEKTASDLCRAHKLNSNVLNRWRKDFLEQAPSIFERGDAGNEHEQKIAELERLVGPPIYTTGSSTTHLNLKPPYPDKTSTGCNSLAYRAIAPFNHTISGSSRDRAVDCKV